MMLFSSKSTLYGENPKTANSCKPITDLVWTAVGCLILGAFSTNFYSYPSGKKYNLVSLSVNGTAPNKSSPNCDYPQLAELL